MGHGSNTDNSRSKTNGRIAAEPRYGEWASCWCVVGLVAPVIERRGDIVVDDSNRETYREPARAGVMTVGNSFARGEDSVYHVTKLGFERKAELLARASAAG
jgi:hypothetical protein